EEFREHLGGELTVTLLADLGTGVEVNTIDADLVAEAMDWLAGREAGCMYLPAGLGELTYCMNIHPGVTWPKVRASLTGPARKVKAALAPDAPFAIGLRFSAQVVEDLKDPAARAELKSILATEGFRPITVNGFPYGDFHGVPVKAEVYQPDWRQDARLTYTCDLADLMADLAVA